MATKAKAPRNLNELNRDELTLSSLTKENMLLYVKLNGDKADKEFFKKLRDKCYKGEEDNRLRNGNNKLPEKVKKYDMKKMRHDFAERFFPELIRLDWETEVDNL